jgi:hypothetical protein
MASFTGFIRTRVPAAILAVGLAGRLSPAQGQPLIDGARQIIDALV